MNQPRPVASKLVETIQSGLPTWREKRGAAFLLDETMRSCDRFFHRTFGEADCSASLFDVAGQRLVDTMQEGALPDHIEAIADRAPGPGFQVVNDQLVYVYDRMERWPSAPDVVHAIAVVVDADWLERKVGLALTPSEYVLVSHLLGGYDLRAAAMQIGANYDTKRKQIQQILDKAGAKNQAALLRDLAVDISARILDELLRPEQVKPEVDMARSQWGRDVILHAITIGHRGEIPIWDFGARRGQPILFFHSMLGPLCFAPNFIETLKARNLRLLMVPRHFMPQLADRPRSTGDILDAIADAVDVLCGEPVICIGESAGCSWAAQFTRNHGAQVTELIVAAVPDAADPSGVDTFQPKLASLLSEVTTKFRQDRRVVSGLARIYNAIARQSALAERSLTFMHRECAADVQSVGQAFEKGALAEWLRLIANTAAHAAIDEVALLQSNWVEDLQSCETPIRFVHGVEDPICKFENAADMAQGMPNAEMIAFEDSGHFVLGQHFDRVLDRLFVH